jgi:hypothetical protein
MKMKWPAIAAVAVMLAMRADALSIFTISILHDGTNVVLTVNQRPLSVEKLKAITAKLGVLDSDQLVLVRLQTSVPAERLLAVLKILKDAGLKSVCVVPVDGAGVGILSLDIHPKTNEFIEVLDSVPDLEDLGPVPERGETGGRTNASALPSRSRDEK